MKGWYITGTGGGGTAERYDFPSGRYALLTDGDDLQVAPAAFSSAYAIGLYDEDGTQAAFDCLISRDAAIAWLFEQVGK